MSKKEKIVNSKSYAVVEFTDEGTCGVIPKLWLIRDNHYCLYPNVPVFKTNNFIQKCIPPVCDGSWSECRVRLLGYEGNINYKSNKT